MDRSRIIPSVLPERIPSEATSQTPGMGEHDLVFGQTAKMAEHGGRQPGLEEDVPAGSGVKKSVGRPQQQVRLRGPGGEQEGDRGPHEFPEPAFHQGEKVRALEAHLVLPEHRVQDDDVEDHPSQPRDDGQQVDDGQRSRHEIHAFSFPRDPLITLHRPSPIDLTHVNRERNST